jgi:hypothetical protein
LPIVPSATLSPSWGIVTLATGPTSSSSVAGGDFRRGRMQLVSPIGCLVATGAGTGARSVAGTGLCGPGWYADAAPASSPP